jgi:hypothetical protein
MLGLINPNLRIISRIDKGNASAFTNSAEIRKQITNVPASSVLIGAAQLGVIEEDVRAIVAPQRETQSAVH